MTDKKYLELIAKFLYNQLAYVEELNEDAADYFSLTVETDRRLSTLKAQEDNIKSDHWEELS